MATRFAAGLAQGFVFGGGYLAIAKLVGDFAVGLTSVAGDLLHAVVAIKDAKVVLLQPAVEHQVDDFVHGNNAVAAQDADFDGVAGGVGGADDEFAPVG